MWFRNSNLDDFWGELARAQNQFSRLLNYRAVPGETPVNLWSDEHSLYVELDLPGLDPSQLEVSVNNGNELSIKGERKPQEIKGAAWVRQERALGNFTREFTLPALVDSEKVEANYVNGVLKLTLPKHEASKPRKIAVKV